MTRISFVVSALLIAVPAFAQSPYVGGTISADIARFSHAESNGDRSSSDDSDVLSGSLRAGTTIGSNWGVELEFVRTGRTHSEGPQVSPLAGTVVPASVASALPNIPLSNLAIPIPIDFRMEVSRRRSDLDAAAWVRQEVSGSVDLVYLAGIVFSRERSDVTETINGRPLTPPMTFRSSFIQYDTDPLVGMEARIGLTSKLRLVPGLRVQGLSDGWLLRPYVGLSWFF